MPCAADLFEMAAAGLRDVMKDHQAISERLRRFLALSSTLHEIRMRRALATQCLREEQAGLSCADLQVKKLMQHRLKCRLHWPFGCCEGSHDLSTFDWPCCCRRQSA